MAMAVVGALTLTTPTKQLGVGVPVPLAISLKLKKQRIAATRNNNRKDEDGLFLLVEPEGSFGSSKTRGGAGLLERPSFDQSQFDPATQLQQGGDIGRLRNKKGVRSGDSYRVLLIDDVRHTQNLVAKVLPQVVPSVTPDDARTLFLKSRENGVAIVIVTVKEHAEFYAQMMIRRGLRSMIEPDSNSV